MHSESNKEMMSKLYLGSEWTMKTNPIYASLGCPKKHGQFEIDMVIDMQRSAYFQLYLFRTGDDYLGYMIYKHETKRGVFCTCSPRGSTADEAVMRVSVQMDHVTTRARRAAE